MDGMNNILDILFLACFGGAGIYGSFTAFSMVRWTELRPNKLIYPSEITPNNCQNPEGFRRYQLPRLIVFSVLALIAAAAFCLGVFVPGMPKWLLYAGYGLSLADIVYYCVVVNKAYRLFWK